MQAIHFHGVLLTVSGGDTIAIYHCSIKIVSRGKGKSAVAAAAYRAGEKLTNEWDGLTHDYTRKGGVVHSEIMLPPHAPPSFSDRSILWNSVEQIEKSNNSQLAREIEIALPVELSREEQTRLVREYCSSQFVSKGMCADFNIHDTGKVSEWQKEFDELKAQSTGEYEELKTKRSEVKELQQIRKCIDIVEQAEQRTQEQTHQTPRRKKEDISL